MIDNEIMKNLECCSRRNEDLSCKDCSNNKIYKIGQICFQNLMGDAFELVSRQKAEIERLQKNIDGLNIFTKNHITVIRLQAIKEFADRLKETITSEINTYYNSNGGGYYLAEDVIEDIDNLVKEMTEELKNDDTKNNISTFDGNRSIR